MKSVNGELLNRYKSKVCEYSRFTLLFFLAAWVAPRNVRSGGPEDYLRTGATFERIIFLLPAEYNPILRSVLRELHRWSLQTHWISLT